MKLIRVPARTLTPYAEPISTGDLKQGIPYFFVTYADEEMLVPTLQPVVFVGRNLMKDDINSVYFQDFDSYSEGIRYETKKDVGNLIIYTGSGSEVGHIFQYDQALDELTRCAIRRHTKKRLGRKNGDSRAPG